MPRFWRRRVEEADKQAVPEDDVTETKLQRIRAEVVSVPHINRNNAGEVSSIRFDAKVQFKGTMTIHARGDVASAYWSVTPGMKLAIHGSQSGDKDFEAHGIDVLPAV